LCFHLFNKQGVKKGQVAHLDQRRANNILDNLAFLCLEHHSEYDSTTSQHKNYTITEVKHARRLLYRWVKRGKPALAKGPQNKASELSESAAGPAPAGDDPSQK
jgi:hypothetical protein